jgi:hypothetical protein
MIKVTYITHSPEKGAVATSDTIEADTQRIDPEGNLILAKGSDSVAGYAIGWVKWEKVDAPAAG